MLIDNNTASVVRVIENLLGFARWLVAGNIPV